MTVQVILNVIQETTSKNAQPENIIFDTYIQEILWFTVKENKMNNDNNVQAERLEEFEDLQNEISQLQEELNAYPTIQELELEVARFKHDLAMIGAFDDFSQNIAGPRREG